METNFFKFFFDELLHFLVISATAEVAIKYFYIKLIYYLSWFDLYH